MSVLVFVFSFFMLGWHFIGWTGRRWEFVGKIKKKKVACSFAMAFSMRRMENNWLLHNMWL